MNPPGVPENLQISHFDKIAHFLMFLALSGVVFFDNTRYLRRKISQSRIFWASFLYPTLFSGSIEILQEFLSSFRTGDWFDFLFDGIGVFIGTTICWFINRKLKSPASLFV
jgi:VanZ family protein